jgi:hypothetical protein
MALSGAPPLKPTMPTEGQQTDQWQSSSHVKAFPVWTPLGPGRCPAIHANIIISNSLFLKHLTLNLGQFPFLAVLASKLGVPVRLMTPFARLTPAAAHPSRAMGPANLPSEPKKSFIYNKTWPVAEPNEPNQPKDPKPVTESINRLKTIHRLASFRHSPIRIGSPSSPPTRLHMRVLYT